MKPSVLKGVAGNLGLDADTISVISNEPVEFGDACLGVAMQDVMCAEVITPGWNITLDVDGVRYELHTDEDASLIRRK